MSANRHLGRIIALQTLFEQDFRAACGDKEIDLDEILQRNIERYKKSIDDTKFIEDIVKGEQKNQKKIDVAIQPLAPEWPLEQIARIDRVILRIATYELLHSKETPPKVVINEAVELAKNFGGENSSKFINGVLGTMLRNQESSTKKQVTRKQKKSIKSSRKKAK